MRRLFRTAAVAAAGLAFAGALGSLAQVVPVLQPPAAPGVAPKSRTENGLFTIPENRDARAQLKAILDYLERKDIPWDVVCRTSQRLLDGRSDSFYRLKDDKGNDTGAVVSVKAKVGQLLAEMPKEGRQFYEQEYGGAATTLLKEATDGGYKRLALSDLSQRYFHTRAGAQATLLLASLELESGQSAEAAYHFQRLLDRPDAAESLTPRVTLKAIVALRRGGDARQAEVAGKLQDQLEKAFPREGVVVGRRAYSLDEVKQELAKVTPSFGGALAEKITQTRLGNASHSALIAGGTPFLDAAFTKPLLYRREGGQNQGADWVQQHIEQAYKSVDGAKKETPMPGFFPVTAADRIVYRAYDGVYAVSTKETADPAGGRRAAGELLWIAKATGGAQTLTSGTDNAAKVWWNQYWLRQSPGSLFENAAAGSLSHDNANVYYVDDLGVLPPPVPQVNYNNGFPQPNGAPAVAVSQGVDGMRNYSRLSAVSLANGCLVWRLGGPESRTLTEAEEQSTTNPLLLFQDAYFLGPPVAVNGKLYVLVEKKGQVKLACLDPSKIIPQVDGGLPATPAPELVWVQALGDATNSVRTESLRRLQPAYLTYADGVMLCPTNCGVVVAVDLNARSLLWARYYGSTPGAPADDVPFAPGQVRPRPIRRPRPNGTDDGSAPTLPHDRWRAAAPVVVGNKLLLTAHDSDLLQCLNLRTGEPLWSTPREPEDLYVGGVFGDKVLVVGKKSVRAYLVDGDGKGGRKLAWDRVAVGTPLGHGAMTQEGLFFLPVLGTPDQPNEKVPSVWALDAATGQVKSKTGFRRPIEAGVDPRTALGNLTFHDGMLYSQTATELSAFPLLEVKRLEMATRLKDNPNDPEGLAARGELSLENGEVAAAIADFKLAQKNKPADATAARIRQKLYVAYTEALRNKFEAGEPHLAEYEALCEVSTESDDPTEQARVGDERVRRRSLFYTLLARGREGQGRLPEAFDAYRAYAALGGNRQLVNQPDDNYLQVRPDVWARGRIESMLQGVADKPDKLQPLQAKVAAEWAALKGANDLPRLREFVGVFGAYFAPGREAQLQLAEKLGATGNEPDAREAQTILLTLGATAGDDAVAARALDLMVKVLVKRGDGVDAVAFAQQLRERYADVPVRDGKTGAQLADDLATDKRLQPYLEPGRAAAKRQKAEVITGPTNRPLYAAFALEPEGELLPYYRRFQLTLEMTPQGNYLLRVTDRQTGEERCRFPNLGVPNAAAFAGQPVDGVSGPRIAYACGSSVLLTLGQFVYCFDLAEKREAWQTNLFGKTPVQNFQVIPDGDGVMLTTDDGWKLRVGRGAIVVQPNYVCLSTRDGLKALNPATGETLWVRTGVSAKAQLAGDGRHVFINDGSSRVLRALDGAAVAGEWDFALTPTGTQRLKSLGAQALYLDADADGRALRMSDLRTGKDVWKRAYPGKTAVLRCPDASLTGAVRPDGTFELLAVATGKVVAAGRIDEDRLGDIRNEAGAMALRDPVALVDAERVYLILNKPQEGRAAERFTNYGGYTSMHRTVSVGGTVFAFDRATGKRLWYNADSLAGHRLFLDRFDELGAFVGSSFTMDQGNAQNYRVTLLDKRTGLLKYSYPHTPNMGDFVAVTFDPASQATEFHRQDLRVRVMPAD